MNSLNKTKEKLDNNNLAYFILLDQLNSNYENKLKYPDVQKYTTQFNETINFMKKNEQDFKSIETELLDKSKAITLNVKTADKKITDYKETNSLLQNEIDTSIDEIETSKQLYHNYNTIYNNNLRSTYIFGALSIGIISLFIKEIHQLIIISR